MVSKKRIFTDEWRKNLSIAHLGTNTGPKPKGFGQKVSNSLKEKYKNGYISPKTGKKQTQEANRKLKLTWEKKIKSGYTCPLHSEESKQKNRDITNKRIENQKNKGLPMQPAIGNCETEILDVLEETIGYKILRQHKVSKYHIDGYCPNYQLAIEIDGPRHKKTIEYDKNRENYIKNKLGCQFIRINIPNVGQKVHGGT